MLIERPPKWYRALFPGALFRVEPAEDRKPRVFLTFDDGPIPGVTPWVLDCLDQFGIKATFFMVGQNIERNPSLFKEVVSRGHAIGNHTLHHIRGLGISADEYFEDARATEILTGSKLFRPPHGWLTPSQLRRIKENYKVVMFDLVTRDYNQHLTSSDITDIVKRLARDGSIIVFHDSIKSFPRIETALPESIGWLKDRGYEFDLLSQL